ncbi:MAG: hypothetical protein LBK59_05115 [Bifidobacteriaceae bacterium]|jgi:hypothetical protein|nr:hypothetical protein [Bifidobacteriaceae bacterium]
MTPNRSSLPSHSHTDSSRFVPARPDLRDRRAWLLYAALAGALTLTTVGVPASCALAAAQIQITAPAPSAASLIAVSADDDAPGSAEVLDTLIADGVEVTLTGQFLQTADGDPQAPETVVALDSGQFVTIDPESVEPSIASGDMIAATVKVPGTAVASLEADMRIDLVKAADAGPLAASDEVPGQLLEAAANTDGPLHLEEASVMESAAQAAASTLPGPYVHTLHFVFMARDDRGVFWSREQLDAYVNGMAEFWIRESRGAVNFVYDWDDVIGTQSPAQCSQSFTEIETAATQALTEANKPTYRWESNDAQHHLVVLTARDEETSPCDHQYGGMAWLLTNFSSPGTIHLIVPTDFDPADTTFPHPLVFGHEIGHNLGLAHAGGMSCPSGRFDSELTGEDACPWGSSWNSYNMMGASLSSGPEYPLSVQQKAAEGMILEGKGYLTIDASVNGAVYTINAGSVPNLAMLQGLRVVDGTGPQQRVYWVDYYANGHNGDRGGVMITLGTASLRFEAGVDSLQLQPAHRSRSGRTLFQPDDSFYSQSGRLRITVVSADIAAGAATVCIDLANESLGVNLSQYTWDPPEWGGSEQLFVDTANAEWIASTSSAWLSVDRNPSNRGVLTIAAGPLGSVGRTGTVTIASGTESATIAVSQQLTLDDCAGEVSTICALESDGDGGIANGSLERGSDRDYWRFVSPTSEMWAVTARYKGLVELTLMDSTSNPLRTAGGGSGLIWNLVTGQTYYIEIENMNGLDTNTATGEYTLTVRPARVDLSVETWDVTESGGSLDVVVTSSTGSFYATTSASWLTASPPDAYWTALSGKVVTVTAEPSSDAMRTGTVRFWYGTGTKTLQVTQAPRAITVSPDVWSPDHRAQDLNIQIASDDDRWSVVDMPDWLDASPPFGATGRVVVSVAANTGPAREGVVGFKTGAYPVTELVVSQEAGPRVIDVAPTLWEPPWRGAFTTGTILLNDGTWALQSRPSWVAVSPINGPAGEIVLTAATNGGDDREGELVFASGGQSATVTVRQTGAPDDCPGNALSTVCALQADGDGATGVGNLEWERDRDYWQLTPLTSGTWVIASEGNGDVSGSLISSGGVLLTYDDGSAGNGQFRMTYDVIAGETYYVQVSDHDSYRTNSDTVAYTLIAGPARIGLSTQTWDTSETAGTLSVSVISTTGGFSARASAAWLSVSPMSGSAATTGQVVTVSAQASPDIQRSATVTFSAGTASTVLRVTQVRRGLTVIPESLWSDHSARTLTVDVVTDEPSWSVSQRPDWIVVTPSTGPRGAVAVSLAANAGAARQGEVIFAAGSYPITRLEVSQAAAPTVIGVAPNAWNPAHGVASLPVTVSLNHGTWTVASAPSWVTVTPRSGGAGQVILTAAVNMGEARQGQAVFASGGQTAVVTIRQSAAPTVLGVSPNAWNPSHESSSITATVSLNHGTWTRQSRPAWVEVSPTSGPPGAEVVLTSHPNAGNARTGEVVFASGDQVVSITVSQSGFPDDCAATTSTTCAFEFDADEGTAAGSLERGSDHDYWRWVPPTSGTWTITAAGTGDVAGFLRGSAGALLTSDDDAAGDGQFRLVDTVVAGQTYYVEIANHTSSDSNTATGPYTLTAQPAQIDVSTQTWEPPYGASSLPVTVTSTTGAFTAGTSASWLSVTPSSGSAAIGGQSVTVSVQANTGAGPRTGTVTFGAGSANIRLQVTQAGSGITISSTGWAPGHTAQTTTVQVVTGPATWSVTNKPDWVTVTPSGRTSGTATVTVAVAENTGALRSGSVVFSAGEDRPTATLYISQAAAPTVIRVTPSLWETPWWESWTTAEVSLNHGVWRVEAKPDWVGLSDTQGVSGSIYVSVQANIGEAREGEVVFVSGGQTAALTIRQDRGPGPDDCGGDISTACVIAFDGDEGTAIGSLERGDDHDYWRLVVPTSGTWSVVATGVGTLGLALLDSDGAHVVSAGSPLAVPSYHVGGEMGADDTYYVEVRNWSSWIGDTDTGPYALTVRPAEVTLSPNTWSPPATRSNLDIAVTSSTGRFAAAPSSNGWLAVYPQSGYPGAASQTLTVTAYPNTGPSRRGEVLFTGGGDEVLARLVVTQAGAPAAITVTPRVWNPPGTGGSTTVQVHTDGTPWEVTDLPAWVTATPSWGTGDTAVTLRAAANSGSAGRMSTVTFSTYAGATSVEVNQPIPPTLSLSRTAWSAPAKADSTTTTVTTNQPEWTATTSASWLSVTPSSGSSGTKATVSVEPNGIPGPVPGSVTFTAGGLSRTMTVTQAAGTLTLSRTSWSAGASGGSTTTKVTTVQPSWEATSDADWVTVSPAEGPSGASITVTAAPNVGPARTASVRVVAASLHATMTVSQAAAPAPTVSLSKTSWSAGAGESSTTTKVTTNQAGWSAEADVEWLSAMPASGVTGDTLTVAATSNPGAARTGSVTVSVAGLMGAASRVVAVSQKGASVSVSRSSWSPSASGAITTAEVTTDQPGWAAASDQDWLTVAPVAGASGESMVWAASVNFGAKRTATVTVAAGQVTRTVTVTQAAAPTGSVSLSRTSWAASSSPGSVPVEVTTNRGVWNAVSSEPWLTVSETSGQTGRIVVVTVEANADLWARTATVTVSAGGASKVLAVTQAAGPRGIDVSHTSWVPAASGDVLSLFALTTSGGTWTASESASWLSLSTTGARTSGASITVNAAANTTASRRQTTVTVKSGSQSTTVTVVQDSSRALTLSKTTWAPSKGGGSLEVTVDAYAQGVWSATSDQPWLVTAGPVSPTDDGLTVLAQPNTGPARTGSVTVRAGDQTAIVTVSQRAG